MNRRHWGIMLLCLILPGMCLGVGYHPAMENFGTGAFTVEGAAGQVTFAPNSDGLNAIMAHTSGNQGSAIVGWSQTGAPAMLLLQDTHFDSPALVIQRSGTTGEVATSSAIVVQGGTETSSTNMLIQAGGCLSLSGDNWFVVWGDASVSTPGGFLDNTGLHKGKLSVDPVHRQLVAEDGITPVLTWTGTGVTVNGHSLKFPLVASVSLDYPSIAANSEESLTLTVTGAIASHHPTVSLGWSDALPDGIVVKQAFVSADNTVTVRVRNETGSAIDPAAVTCKVIVLDY